MRQRQSHVPINKLAFLVLNEFGDLSISLPRGSGLLSFHALISLSTCGILVRRVVTGTRNMWWLHQLTQGRMQDGRACSYLLIMSNASDHYSLIQTKDSH